MARGYDEIYEVDDLRKAFRDGFEKALDVLRNEFADGDPVTGQHLHTILHLLAMGTGKTYEELKAKRLETLRRKRENQG